MGEYYDYLTTRLLHAGVSPADPVDPLGVEAYCEPIVSPSAFTLTLLVDGADTLVDNRGRAPVVRPLAPSEIVIGQADAKDE